MYHHELFESPNITLQGFVGVGTPEFKKILSECVAVIYPYPEGEMNGSVMTCMNHGLIPIIAFFSNEEIAKFAELVDGTKTPALFSACRKGNCQQPGYRKYLERTRCTFGRSENNPARHRPCPATTCPGYSVPGDSAQTWTVKEEIYLRPWPPGQTKGVRTGHKRFWLHCQSIP